MVSIRVLFTLPGRPLWTQSRTQGNPSSPSVAGRDLPGGTTMFWGKSEAFDPSSMKKGGVGGEHILTSFMGSQRGVTGYTTPEDGLESTCRMERGGSPRKYCLLMRVHQEQELPGRAL